ncbi:MAG: polysaccharide deacetylase family protein, partial [bacterium]
MTEAIGASLLAFAAFSARWNWWRKKAQGLPVPIYHKIGVPPRGARLRNLWISPARFRRQLEYLKSRGYVSVTFSELAAVQRGRGKLPKNPVLITFDDGYMNNYTDAFPVLRETGMKGNIFLVYDAIGKHNIWHNPDTEPWTDMLTWETAREMLKSGLVEFGSHTMGHPNLKKIPVEQAA